jgi:hypothetical protein
VGFAADFFVSASGAFFSRGVAEDRGVGEAFTAGFFGVGFGVAFGVDFGVAVGAGVGRGVEGTGGSGGGVAISSSPLVGCGLGAFGGGSSSTTCGSGVGSGIFATGAAGGAAAAFVAPALPSIQTTSVTAGFFALPLQRARPKRTATCTTPMIATLRQKLPRRVTA